MTYLKAQPKEQLSYLTLANLEAMAEVDYEVDLGGKKVGAKAVEAVLR
ncbi:hypothetical protein [uncultured Rikenella sp.]|nr:hypothetical protein [uncultured Rikenella sp.]